jgi:hypothetical protein
VVSENQPAEVSAPKTASSDSGLLMIGAAIVLGAWLIFDVIMGEFGYVAFYYAVAALVLMSILGVGGLRLSNRTLKLLGYFMGLVGLFLLVDDLRYGFPDGVADNLANIVFYVGFLLMFVGARGLSD